VLKVGVLSTGEGGIIDMAETTEYSSRWSTSTASP